MKSKLNWIKERWPVVVSIVIFCGTLAVLGIMSCVQRELFKRNPYDSIEEKELRKTFEGRWDLKEWVYKYSDDQKVTQVSVWNNPVGCIHYDSEGNMYVVLQEKERKHLENPKKGMFGQNEDYEQAFSSMLFYSGKFFIDRDKKTVTHAVEFSSIQNWVGTSQFRKFEFLDDDTLVLSNVNPIGYKSFPSGNHFLTWTKSTSQNKNEL